MQYASRLDPELGAVWIGTWCGLDWLTAQPDLRPGARDPAGEATWPVSADVTGPGLKGAARPEQQARLGMHCLRRGSGFPRALVPRGGELARARNVTLHLPPGRCRLVLLDRADDLVVLDRVLTEHARTLAVR